MNDIATSEPPAAISAADVVQDALIDSRQRWRDLVALAADFAFETDAWGNFTLITPDPALGWAVAGLIGQPSAELLTDGGGDLFNPFRVDAEVRHRKAWLKRGDGGVACLTCSAAPILGHDGSIAGTRGIGFDITEYDGRAARVAAALRRAEVLDHILCRMGQEVVVARMMRTVLGAIADAVGAEGTAVILGPSETAEAVMAHATGTGAEMVVDVAVQHLGSSGPRPGRAMTNEGRPVIVADCQTRFGQKGCFAVWRGPGGRRWDEDDSQLIRSAVNIIRMVLEHEAAQRETTRQARTDPLTGLLNRRAFLEEMERHAARQDREHEMATLLYADLDNFKPVNDRLGHEAGDEVLQVTAALLRNTFRPTDLVARLGGDEFAVWLNGADHMTAAERAEFLRDAIPLAMDDITGPNGPRVSLSIGIASRDPGEPLDNLMRRADAAMYEVKRGGRGHWRVSLRRRP